MARCDECKHWERNGGDYIDTEPNDKFVVGLCERALPFWDATDWDFENMTRALKPEYADRKFFAQDGSDYRATVYTTPDFFCAEFASVE